MKDLLQYIFSEVKSERLSKIDAIDLIQQIQPQFATSTPYSSHPLLQENTSDFSGQRFSSTFTGQEFFLADHIVNGQRALPGVAYLEMARAAVAQAAESVTESQTGIRLKNVVWARPIVVRDQDVQVHIGLCLEDNGDIVYEIYSGSEDSDEEPIIHSQGKAIQSPVTEAPFLDLAALQAQCNQKKLSPGQCYKAFRTIGLNYGPGHQGIENVYVGLGKILAKLSLPPSISNTREQFVLHPSLLDAALQALIGLIMDGDKLTLALPYALEELEVFDSCTTAMWAFIRYSDGSKARNRVQKFDLDLCDEHGKVCVRMKEFSLRVLEDEAGWAEPVATIEPILLQPYWREQAIVQEIPAPDYAQHLVMFCVPGDETQKNNEIKLDGVRCLTLQSEQKRMENRFLDYTIQVFEEIQRILKEKFTDKVLVQIIVSALGEQHLFCGLGGLLKTARLENPKVTGQVIEVEAGEDTESIIKKIKENSCNPIENQVRYQAGKRYVASWSEVETIREELGIPWKDRGIYLITGGAGGLGLIFAREIAQRVKDATLILAGRSSLNEDKQLKFRQLENSGVRVVYRQVDVAQKKAVIELIQNIQDEFGSLHGIIHSAGVIRDNFIIKKSREELQEVLSPKVSGLVNLDQATREISLDFFILFSSVVGGLGNVGQADYAVANAFMDAYARYRNTLMLAQQRHGKTLSINWPLWKEGGLRVDKKIEKEMRRNMGIVPIKAEVGIKALYQGLASGKQQVMLVAGDHRRLRATLLGQPTNAAVVKMPSAIDENKAVAVVGKDLLSERVIILIKELFSSVTKLSVDRIEADVSLEKYGIDSIMIIQLTNQLEKIFGSLSKTLFFEYQTIREVSNYFLDSHRDKICQLLNIEGKAAATINDSRKLIGREDAVKTVLYSRRRTYRHTENREEKVKTALDIAIIGVSGRYPQAENIRDLWRNLCNGQDCITEIPPSRWDYHRHYVPNKDIIGKSYSKWGGFLEDIDQFDPLHFNIAPSDARRIDPQERLFLESVWETIEDAGYTRAELRKNPKVGVFVGVMWSEYQLLGGSLRDNFVPALPSYASIANRISYFYNFHGPSIALDTMCSSSLTAIYLACNSIYRGDCEIAIAGGVNLSLHPNKYAQLSMNRFLSSDGRCRSFGEGGDGYVPGEGIGTVLLKPLTKAVADRDQIYAIIKDISVNHGGKTNGYSVPNLNAQADLITESLQKAQVDPRTITYIETHGTGTSLGDPIEINALTKVFSKFTTDKQFCTIGSIKSNIGHLEAAAGIAGLTKLLLQLKYKQIVPSLHSMKLNPNIDFNNSPFYVQQKLTDWNPLVENENGILKTLSRRAAISSFGAGGSNAHMILEEYSSATKLEGIHHSFAEIMVLSARTKTCMYEYAKRLRNFCNANVSPAEEIAISDMIYTLQVGREPMQERLAIIGETMADFVHGLTKFLDNPEGSADQTAIFYGCVSGVPPVLLKNQSEDEVLPKLIQQRDLTTLAALWVEGITVPWEKLHYGNTMRRISLPTYPFERKSYWISQKDDSSVMITESGDFLKNQPNKQSEEFSIRNKLDGKITVPNLGFESDEKVLQQVLPAEYISEGNLDKGYDEIQNVVSHVIMQNLGLELEELNTEVDLITYGLDSLTQIRIINDLRKEYGAIISPEIIFEQSTVKKLAKFIGEAFSQRNSALHEAVMESQDRAISQNIQDDKLDPLIIKRSKLLNESSDLKTNNILINGVTGVLGGRLIREYLEMTDSTLYCLVRAKDISQAKQRIQAMFEVYNPDHSLLLQFDRRVIPVLGDITKPSLGLQPELYKKLTGLIDMVVHSAGKTSLHGVYSAVKAVNVDGTQNMVNFALNTKQKYFIHISTIAVMGDRQYKAGQFFKETDFDLGQKFQNLGYPRSKFEAEKIVRSTQDLKWIIMRSGYIMGDSKTGNYPLTITGVPGIYYDLLKTAIQLEMAVDNSWYFDITPIDYSSRSIVWLSTSLKDIHQTYHLANSDHKTLKEIFTIVNSLGYPIRFVHTDEYINFLQSKSNSYRSITTDLMLFNPIMIPSGDNTYADTTYTTEVLAPAGIRCPKIDEKLIATYLEYCTKVGYLEKNSYERLWNWHFKEDTSA